MPSTLASMRRKPQQARAAERRAQLLAAGARVLAEQGYEAATMTAVAQTAKASIGTLYDYFPDKQALALALLKQYADEADTYWAEKFDESHAQTAAELAEQLVSGVLGFVADRPAYLALQNAPVIYRRLPAMRLQIRRLFATEIQRLQPNLATESAMLAASVAVELIKALIAVYKDSKARERKELRAEFRKILTIYLCQV